MTRVRHCPPLSSMCVHNHTCQGVNHTHTDNIHMDRYLHTHTHLTHPNMYPHIKWPQCIAGLKFIISARGEGRAANWRSRPHEKLLAHPQHPGLNTSKSRVTSRENNIHISSSYLTQVKIKKSNLNSYPRPLSNFNSNFHQLGGLKTVG